MYAHELEAINSIIKINCGSNAVFRLYDRRLKTPMNMVIDAAQNQINMDVIPFWVEKSLPENFFLSGFSKTPVIYSTRFVELSYLFRQVLMADKTMPASVPELTERLALKVMAEFCLKLQLPDLAVLLFAKSSLGKSIYTPDKNILAMLEYEPKHEAYMVMWFYGLTHELGHVCAKMLEEQPDPKQFRHPYSDEEVMLKLNQVLDKFDMPQMFRTLTMERALHEDDFFLSIKNLRNEIIADTFAVNVLLDSTTKIMYMEQTKKFRVDHFVAEIVMLFNSIWMLERCKRTVHQASTNQEAINNGLDSLFHPVSVSVRLSFVAEFLQYTLCDYLYNGISNATKDQLEGVSELVSIIVSYYQEVSITMEIGLAKAMRFVLFPAERDPDLYGSFIKSLLNSENFIEPMELEHFCELADSFNAKGKLLQELQLVMNRER